MHIYWHRKITVTYEVEKANLEWNRFCNYEIKLYSLYYAFSIDISSNPMTFNSKYLLMFAPDSYSTVYFTSPLESYWAFPIQRGRSRVLIYQFSPPGGLPRFSEWHQHSTTCCQTPASQTIILTELPTPHHSVGIRESETWKFNSMSWLCDNKIASTF